MLFNLRIDLCYLSSVGKRFMHYIYAKALKKRRKETSARTMDLSPLAKDTVRSRNSWITRNVCLLRARVFLCMPFQMDSSQMFWIATHATIKMVYCKFQRIYHLVTVVMCKINKTAKHHVPCCWRQSSSKMLLEHNPSRERADDGTDCYT